MYISSLDVNLVLGDPEGDMLVCIVDFGSETQTAEVVVLRWVYITLHVVEIGDQRVEITSERLESVCNRGVGNPRQDIRFLIVHAGIEGAEVC